MRVNNVEPMRSMDEGWKGTVLLLLCSLLQGAWGRLLQLLIDALLPFSYIVINGIPHNCDYGLALLFSQLLLALLLFDVSPWNPIKFW